MTSTPMVFERYEKKYMLTKTKYNQLRERLGEYMDTDRYGLHTISSVYYDTDDFHLIRASSEKPVYKEKIRLRAYNIPAADSTVFLELKKKLNGVVYKRRIALPLWEAEQYLERGRKPADQGQIFQEIDWAMRRYNPVAKALLANDRVALCGREDKDVRVTFDFNLRWRDYNLDLKEGSYGESLLPRHQCLMEVKVGNAMPLWLAELLAEEEIFPRSFSKYGTCYRENILRKGEWRHAG